MRLEIVRQAEKQGSVLGLDCLAFHNLPDRTVAELPFLLSVRIGYAIVAEKQLFPDQFYIIKAIIGTAFFYYLSFTITDAPV